MKIKRSFYLFICLFLLIPIQIFPQIKHNKGCDNIFNSCFLNATMQALYHTTPLKKFLDKNHTHYNANSTVDLLYNHLNTMELKFLDTEQVHTFREKIMPKLFPVIFEGEDEDEKQQWLTGQNDAAEFLTPLLSMTKEQAVYYEKIKNEIDLFFTQNFEFASPNYFDAQKLAESIGKNFENTEITKIHNEKTIKEWFIKEIEKKEIEGIIYELEKQLSNIIQKEPLQTKKFINFLEQRIKRGQEIELEKGKFEKLKKLLNEKNIEPKDLIDLINKTISIKLLGKDLAEKEVRLFFDEYDEETVEKIVRSWIQIKEEDPVTNGDYYTLFNAFRSFKKTGDKFINFITKTYKNLIKKVQNNDWKNFIETQEKARIHRKDFTGMVEIQTQKTSSCELNHSSAQGEIGTMLTLSIEDCDSLEECFQAYTKKEPSALGSRWDCPDCTYSKTKTFVQDKIQKLPEILIIQLKRFAYNKKTKIFSKIPDPITFKTQLDMTLYLPADTEKQKTLYNLYAIIIHSGPYGGGHYYTYANTTKGWYLYDDIVEKKAQPINTNQIEAIANQDDKEGGPYILFYERADIQNELYEKEDPITIKINQLKNALETYKKSLIKLADTLQETKKNIG